MSRATKLAIACVDNRMPVLQTSILDRLHGPGNYFLLTDVGSMKPLREGATHFEFTLERIESLFQLCSDNDAVLEEIHLLGHEDCRGYSGLCSCKTTDEWHSFMRNEVSSITTHLATVPLFKTMKTRFRGGFITLAGTYHDILLPCQAQLELVLPAA